MSGQRAIRRASLGTVAGGGQQRQNEAPRGLQEAAAHLGAPAVHAKASCGLLPGAAALPLPLLPPLPLLLLPHGASRLGAACRTMVTQLIKNERIETTVQKAKELRRLADKVVSLGKQVRAAGLVA